MPDKVSLSAIALILCLVIIGTAYGETAGGGDDTVVFKNGDRISGRLTKANSIGVQLDSQALGSLTIPWSHIAEVESHRRRWRLEGQGPTKYADFDNALLRVKDNAALFKADSLSIPVSSNESLTFIDQEHTSSGPQLQAVKAPARSPDTSFAVSLNAPLSVVNGTQSQIVLGGSIRALLKEPNLCKAPMWFTALLLAANHNRSYKVKTPAIVTDTYDATLSLKKGVGSSDRVAWYVVAGEWGNSSLGIGLQQSYGAGISSLFWSNECSGRNPVLPKGYRFTINGDVGMRYIRQRLYAPAGDTRDFAGVRLGENLVYAPLFKDAAGDKARFTIDQSLWVMPILNDAKAIQAGGSLNFSFPITPSLSLSLGEEDDFINNAPKAKRKNYLKSSLSLTYSFPAK